MNINDRCNTDYLFYKISEKEFNTYISSLINNNLVKSIKSNPKSTCDYIVSDLKKHQEWQKSDFYSKLSKYIVPGLEIALCALGYKH